MNDIKDLHHRAMELSDSALRARLENNPTLANRLLYQAFESERDAASLSSTQLDLEPARSVLHRSAASLAMECGEFREAERLIASALVGNPPEEIADELRDLLEQVHFRRHLSIRGITLEEDELQLSLSGRTVGYGIVLTEEFVGRVQAFEKLIFRTAERRLGVQYHETSVPIREVRENFEVFVSVPKAASFAVSLRIGRPHQQGWLPTMLPVTGGDIMDDIVSGLDELNRSAETEIRARLATDAYFRNFIGLAKRIVPDGTEVRMVGLALTHRDIKRELQLVKTRRELRPARRAITAHEHVSITGSLLYADATSARAGRIKVIDEQKVEHTVIVPEGMMSDIVRPLWEDIVTVEGIKTREGIRLDDIRRADSENRYDGQRRGGTP